MGPNDHAAWGYFLRLYLNRRLAGLPAFISRETATGGSLSYFFSSAKAQRELGWTYRPAKEMWLDIIDQERTLLASRPQRDWVARLKPME
jgi:hypothetical protein